MTAPLIRRLAAPLGVLAAVLAASPASAQALDEPQDPTFFLWIARSLFLTIIVALAASVSFAVVLRATKSDLIDREVEILENHRTAAFWWGLPTAALLFILMGALIDSGEHGQGMGYIVGGLLLAATIIGGTGLANKVGRQIMVTWNRPDASPGGATAAGAATMFLLTLIPLVGWAYGIYNIILSVGAFRLAAISRRRRPPTPPRVRTTTTATAAPPAEPPPAEPPRD